MGSSGAGVGIERAISNPMEGPLATAAKFRIDVAIHDLLMNSTQMPPSPAEQKGLTLPEPLFPQFPQRLKDPGPEVVGPLCTNPGQSHI